MFSTSSNTDSPLPSISSSPSSSFSSTFQWRYDVFISFRAEDTGKNFTGQLYAAFDRSAIYAFRSDQKIEKGENITQELSKAIEESRFSIIIFSKTYASSTWCLDELEKIIKCKNELGQIVIPIFYDVNPSDVRNQTGRFREAFIDHEKAFRNEAGKVQKWREAMAEAGNIAGFDLMDRAEAEFIQDIVKDISNKLTPVKLPSPYKKLVGINWRLRKLCAHIGLETSDVRIIGILGMGGIGKTTLARVVYEHLSRDFQGRSFLADVREVSQKGNIISLQSQLLCQIFRTMLFTIWSPYEGSEMIRRRLRNRKVLVILDDVDDVNQLENLARNRDWFGPGSRIIITTRNEHLLATYGVDAVYKAESLGYYEALQLLSSKAFKNDQPPGDYQMLCNHVIKYAGGLPLALEVLGSSLYGRSVDEWTNTLERLKEFSDEEILGKLKISFDGLEETEKRIFLDIAYFFKGENRDYVTKILESCDFFPIIGIKVLIEKCLISISKDDDLLMHDLLQEMAKKIVEKQDKDPGKRSRLWTEDETCHVLIKNMGTDAVEGINHKFSEGKKICLSLKAFSNMDNLRVLKIFNVHLPQGFDYLSNEIRLLEWHGYPLKSLPSSFHPEKLVALSLKYSRVQKLWKGVQILNKLKFIDLSHSQYLTKTPNFVGVPNLESLILEGCIRLSEIHPSVGELKRIVLLNLKDCKHLVRLPSFVNLESLEVLILAGCSKLKKFPKVIGEMESLEKLDVSETMMEDFPPSIFLLMKSLKEVSFQGCKALPNKSWHLLSSREMQRRMKPVQFILSSLSCLSSLRTLAKLNLSNCSLCEAEILVDLCHLSSLTELDLSGNDFDSLPSSFNQLSNLQDLVLNECKRLKTLPESPSKLIGIEASNCISLESLVDAVKFRSSASYTFLGLNCFKLAGNDASTAAFAMMKRHLQGRQSDFHIVLPGRDIPEWCTNQSEGSSISIDTPATPHHGDNDKFVGLLACCIFYVNEHPPVRQGRNIYGSTHWIFFEIKGSSKLRALEMPCFYFVEKKGRAISNHIWLVFLSVDSSLLEGLQFSSGNEEEEENCFEISYGTSGPGIGFKKCGIRLVYERDMEELKQSMSAYDAAILESSDDALHQD